MYLEHKSRNSSYDWGLSEKQNIIKLKWLLEINSAHFFCCWEITYFSFPACAVTVNPIPHTIQSFFLELCNTSVIVKLLNKEALFKSRPVWNAMETINNEYFTVITRCIQISHLSGSVVPHSHGVLQIEPNYTTEAQPPKSEVYELFCSYLTVTGYYDLILF